MQTVNIVETTMLKTPTELKNEEWRDIGSQETWKDILNYEGLYQISSLGNVKSLIKSTTKKIKTPGGYRQLERILKPALNNGGYFIVTLSKNNHHKTCPIHKLVATAFIPNTNNKPQINHIDCNKLNNSVKNLEWVTAQENSEHAILNGLTTFEHLRGENHKNSKLTKKKINQIREDYYINNCTLSEIAKNFGICPQTAHEIVTFKMWGHVTQNYDLYLSMKDERSSFHKRGENNFMSKLELKEIKKIRKLHSTKRHSLKELGIMFNTSPTNISSIVNNKTWRHI